MEKYPPRESIFFGYSPQISIGNSSSSSSPRIPDGNSDIDFNDLFGGPPRRHSSITLTRYSSNQTTDSFTSKEDDKPVVSRNLWSGLSEKSLCSSSMVLTPVRPLSPMAETFEIPSLPAKFSLPARLVRGIDFGANHSNFPPLPRVSSQSREEQSRQEESDVTNTVEGRISFFTAL